MMATESFREIVRETESIVGNIGLFIVEEQCRRVGKCSDTLLKEDEPKLLMEVLVAASLVAPPDQWKKLERIFKRRITGIK